MRLRFLAIMGLALAGMVVCPVPAAAGNGTTLKAFKSDADLLRYLKRVEAKRAGNVAGAGVLTESASPPAPAPDAKSVAAPAAGATNGITNNQEQGVDEGDIVKASGDFLIVLRRGRLFTVSLAGGGMKPVDSIDAYPPGVDPRGDWYDEMLIAGDRIVVIGYSYSRGGTQVNRFRLGKDGRLSFEDAYALKSNDYYSSRNYASRLIGTKLVFYSPRYLPWRIDDVVPVFPALRRWTAEGRKGAFKPIGTARNVFVSPGQDIEAVDAVHTVSSCDLAAPVLRCKATSILGPSGRVFYVSSNAVYVWAAGWQRAGRSDNAILYRLPLDGSAPQALQAFGAPVDQFSFRESGNALDVLVRTNSPGEAMWESEQAHGEVALVHVPLSEFGDGTGTIARGHYRPLPQPKGNYWSFHNRFAGDFLLYGEGNGWGAPKGYVGEVTVVPLKKGYPVTLSLTHGVDRIEVMGRDAVVVGSDGKNVVFSAVTLRPRQTPALGDRYVLGGASQAETRSHGFFFNPESADGENGVLGLPVMRTADPAFHHLFGEAAEVVFVRRSAGKFGLLGGLPSYPKGARDDGCKASCVDWYGNSRPIFYGARTFALMGYELVEGVLGMRDLAEKGRLNFTPSLPQPARAPVPE